MLIIRGRFGEMGRQSAISFDGTDNLRVSYKVPNGGRATRLLVSAVPTTPGAGIIGMCRCRGYVGEDRGSQITPALFRTDGNDGAGRVAFDFYFATGFGGGGPGFANPLIDVLLNPSETLTVEVSPIVDAGGGGNSHAATVTVYGQEPGAEGVHQHI